MFHSKKLYGLRIAKDEDHSPFASDPKRQKTSEFAGKMFRMKKWMIRILTKILKKGRKLSLLLRRNQFDALQKPVTVNDCDHIFRSLARKDAPFLNVSVGFSRAIRRIRSTNSGRYSPSVSIPTQLIRRERRAETSSWSLRNSFGNVLLTLRFVRVLKVMDLLMNKSVLQV